MNDLPDRLLHRLRAALGADAVLTGEPVRARPVSGRVSAGCDALTLVRPRTTAEVALTLSLCHAAGQPVVPRAGMTGLVNGALAGPREIALSLERLDRIEELDAASSTLTVQAGVTLQAVQEHAAAHGLLFALDLGARGSATIGGAVSTNAGGNSVIRYGMMRDLVLGLEAVLADGTVVSSLTGVVKNNTGLDLKQLFIGTEGTLGVVTRAVLRLHPLPRARRTALAALPDFDAVAGFLAHMRAESGGTLAAFEAMWAEYYELATRPAGRLRPPLPAGATFYVLVEWDTADEPDNGQRFETALSVSLDKGLIGNAVVANSGAERTALWAIRDDVSEHLRPLGPHITYDISLPVPAMAAYVETLARALPVRPVVFGHVGDGNLHVAVPAAAGAGSGAVEDLVYTPLAALGGSVSAEHGVGLDRKPYLHLTRSDAERRVMALVKRALDPTDILNPGKVLDAPR